MNLNNGDFVDIYSIPNFQNNEGLKSSLTFKHIKIIAIDRGQSTYNNQIGVVIEVKSNSLLTQLDDMNGANLVVVQYGN